MRLLLKVGKEVFYSKSWRKAFFAIFIASSCYMLFPVDAGEAARRMVFIFVIAALFWGMEIIPLYATSILLVLLEIFLLSLPKGILPTSAGGYKIFFSPFGSPIIMLFFGGLSIAVALRKYRMDILIACKLLSLFGKNPFFILTGFMVTTAFLSMWMSNTATTAMMIAMVIPLLDQIKKEDPFRKGIVLCIPFAANIGGIGTPVGTPPNAIAIGILADHGINLNFVSWMKMAVPLVVLLLGLVLIVIYLMFPPKEKELDLKIENTTKLNREGKVTAAIVFLTIFLWVTSSFHHIPSAVVALIAVSLLFSFNILNQSDMKKIDWDVLVLMWGGLALGKGLGVTGLTTWIIGLQFFNQTGIILVVIFSFLGLMLGTFMSHTATANLLIPIVLAIPGQNNVFLAITVALACSFAMALPISTPPNAIAFSTNMISVKDMFKSGLLISFLSYIILLMGFQVIITKVFGL